MKAADVKSLSSMPLSSPSYPRGPYRFIDREYLIVTYESGPDAIREALPDIDGSQAIAQLIGYNLTDIQVKGDWSGPARLQLHAHVNAPVADLPVRKVHGAVHFIADWPTCSMTTILRRDEG
jgi:acetoacetate decarboxylase